MILQPPFRFVDLSVPLAPSPSENIPVSVDYIPHHVGGQHLAELVGIPSQLLPDALGWASERISANTHSGTHVDAPFHYSPQCNSAPSRTIEEIPVEWFWGRGIRIDVGAGKGARIQVAEFLDFEKGAGIKVEPHNIVLFHTGAALLYGSPTYSQHGRGLATELVELLCDRGVRVFGTDSWSIDPPFGEMTREAQVSGPSTIWSAHFVGRRREFCAVERLCNLHLLPPFGFWVACFPVKVARGSAAWTRAVAIIG